MIIFIIHVNISCETQTQVHVVCEYAIPATRDATFLVTPVKNTSLYSETYQETTRLERPHIYPTLPCNLTCRLKPPIFMANGAVFQDRFYCIKTVQTCQTPCQMFFF